MPITRRTLLAAGAATAAAAIPNLYAQSNIAEGLKIEKIEAIRLRVKLKERFWMSLSPIGGMDPALTKTIITIRTNKGHFGLGECSGSAADLLRRGFGEFLIGEDPYGIEDIWHTMFALTHSRERARRNWSSSAILQAMAGIDAALWDLAGKVAGLPLYKLLGGSKKAIDCYTTGAYYREGKGIPEMRDELQMYLDMGYRAVKMKVGGVSVAEDVERVAAARDLLGPDVRIMLDANKGWDIQTTIEACRALEPLDITWMEEPLHWYDPVDGLRRVKDNVSIPLASGEGESTRWGCRRLLDTGVIDFLQFDAHARAGITEWMKVAHMAAMSHVRMAPHHEPQLHVHLLCAIPNPYILESFGNADRDPFWKDLYVRKPELVNSTLTPTDDPGIGVAYNQDFLDTYGTKIL